MLSLRDAILVELDKLTQDQQQVVLDFTRSLIQSNLPLGTPGEVLLEHMGTFHFEPGELDLIAKAIEDCERIDLSEWE